MILVQSDSVDDLEVMASIVAGARNRGTDTTRRTLDDVRLVFIGRHPASTVANLVAEQQAMPDTGLMTRRQAARALTCSTSTVDRRVAEGKLTNVDGRITAASIHAYLKGQP